LRIGLAHRQFLVLGYLYLHSPVHLLFGSENDIVRGLLKHMGGCDNEAMVIDCDEDTCTV
jgi:hypothetical protein